MVLAPPPAFPGDVAWNLGNLLSSWIVGPLYGINICVYILCARVLYLKGLQGVNLLMLIVASVQFALATGHVSTLVVELIRGFLNPAWTPGGTSLYLLNPAEPERIAQAAMYLTNSLIGDAILIWRLWILWNRNFFITAPFIMLCIGTAAASYTALVHLSHLSLTDTVFVARVHDWLTATWALSIATQFGATLLIVYRFWICIQWNVKGIRESRLAVLWILVESGALYSVTTIFMLGFSTTNTGGIISSALGQISALGPTLIIVRAGMRGSNSSSSFTPVKGSINRSHIVFRSPQDVELGSQGNTTVVHVGKATEIRLHNLEHRDGDVSSSDGTTRSTKSDVYVPDKSGL